MYIIAVDDEIQALEALRQTIKKAAGDCEAAGFVTPLKALEYAGNNQIDVAFLDIHMDELDSLVLAGRLIGLHPWINIIFVTKHPEYMQNAFSLHASGYILKPAQP